ncbi:MAG: EamA family transporter [Candidatus Melainabacteria bacterium]|jgi:transporter family protein|nr:MAG: EamA family transporter [Candidatus Melainabacteria bacterium]
MNIWIWLAFISMFFAGFTSVIAKKVLANISRDLGPTIRTYFVFVFVLAFAWFAVPNKDWSSLKISNLLWLGASAVTTTISWIFYYKAIKLGDVSTVTLIDKGSVIVAVLLAFFVLQESITTAQDFLNLTISWGYLFQKCKSTSIVKAVE